MIFIFDQDQGFEIGFDISTGESQRSDRCELQKVLRDCARTGLEVNRRSRFTQSVLTGSRGEAPGKF